MALTKTQQDAVEQIVSRLQALVTPYVAEDGTDGHSTCFLGGIHQSPNGARDREIKEEIKGYIQSWLLPHAVALLNGDPERLLRDYGRIDTQRGRDLLAKALDEYTPGWAKPEPHCNHDAVAVVDGVCECGTHVGVRT